MGLGRDAAGGRRAIGRELQDARPGLPLRDEGLDLGLVGLKVPLHALQFGHPTLGLLACRLRLGPLGLQSGHQRVILDRADPLDEPLLGGREPGKLGQEVSPLGGALLLGAAVVGLALKVRGEALGRERLPQ